jgi:tRNA(Ile)-lysidine synthase
MSLLKEVNDFIENEKLIQKNDALILAVSGGVDSVVLVDICYRSGFSFKIAHCNFQLRGEESDLDEKLVAELGEKYRSPVFSKRFKTEKYANERNLSIQVAARQLRYHWFDELIELEKPLLRSGQALYLATAHHANDNIETLLMNFFKGTGIKGLCGIPVKQNNIIRPLLFAEKEVILSYAGENQLSFREDASNRLDKYTRNYFRNTIIPLIEKVFPAVEKNLQHDLQRFKDVHLLYQQAIEFHKKKLMTHVGNEVHIPVLKLLKSEPVKTLLFEIIKNYGFTTHQLDDAIQLLHSETGRFVASETHKLIRNRNRLIISSLDTLSAETIVVESGVKEIRLSDGKLLFGEIPISEFKKYSDNSVAMIDAAMLRFPLIVRNWKTGDYFYPLGLKKTSGKPAKKKLSRFFIDQKLSLTDKEKIRVLETDKKIAWVIGMRIDDRFKVTDRTKIIFLIRFREL